MRLAVVAVSGGISLPEAKSPTVYLVNASDRGFIITLPDAALSEGYHFYIKRTDISNTNPVTIATKRGSGQKIDGLTSLSLTKYKFCHILAHNGHWLTI